MTTSDKTDPLAADFIERSQRRTEPTASQDRIEKRDESRSSLLSQLSAIKKQVKAIEDRMDNSENSVAAQGDDHFDGSPVETYKGPFAVRRKADGKMYISKGYFIVGTSRVEFKEKEITAEVPVDYCIAIPLKISDSGIVTANEPIEITEIGAFVLQETNEQTARVFIAYVENAPSDPPFKRLIQSQYGNPNVPIANLTNYNVDVRAGGSTDSVDASAEQTGDKWVFGWNIEAVKMVTATDDDSLDDENDDYNP